MGMKAIQQAILDGAGGDELAALPIPETYRAVYVHEDDQHMFDGVDPDERDASKSYRLGEVETPELAPNECYVAVMASSINFNTLWMGTFQPMSTFPFLKRYAAAGGWNARHDQPFHVGGSDASGVVLRTGSMVRHVKPGDRVILHALALDPEEPASQADSMVSEGQRIIGYETNFGGHGELMTVPSNALLPMPSHLTWEEAGSIGSCLAPTYRMLGRNGADLQAGQRVLVWGAAGGLGAFAIQLALLKGAVPIGVVSSPDKAELLRSMGVDAVIDRRAEGYRFWTEDGQMDTREIRRLQKKIRELVGADPEVVYEHSGRETMAASVAVAARGGAVVTCGATSGYEITYDQRLLWMQLKRIIGAHGSNLQEAAEAAALVAQGRIHPTVSVTKTLEELPAAAKEVADGMHVGKVAIRLLSPEDGLGVTDPELRERHLDSITRFSRFRAGG